MSAERRSTLSEADMSNAAAMWDMFAGQGNSFRMEGNPQTGIIAYWTNEPDVSEKKKELLDEKAQLQERLLEISFELKKIEMQ